MGFIKLTFTIIYAVSLALWVLGANLWFWEKFINK